MYRRRRARIVLAGLSLITIVLVTIDVRSGGTGMMDSLRTAVTSALAPVQEGLAAATRPLGEAAGAVGDLFQLRSENEQLRRRLEELQQRRESFTDLERQNRELRDLLGMRDRVSIDTRAARTIGFAPSNYEWSITIDIGTSQGVRRDMPVINEDGLVGRVIQTGRESARVLLAIDPQFSAASRIASSGETGIIAGQGGGLMSFEPFDSTAPIEQDQTVVTSGYEGGTYPSGIPVGSVERPGEVSTRLQRDVGVRPFVDFTRLDQVLVLLHQPGEPLPPVEGFEDVPFEPPEVAGPRTPRPGPTPAPTATP